MMAADSRSPKRPTDTKPDVSRTKNRISPFQTSSQKRKTVQNASELVDYMEYRFQAIHDNLTEIFSETDTPSAFESQYEIMRDKLLKLPESTF